MSDPVTAIGQKLTLPLKDDRGSTIPEDDLVVVFLGNCQSCQIKSYTANDLRPRGGRAVLYVAEGEVSAPFLRSTRPDDFIISDKTGSLTMQVRVAFRPWVALVNSGEIVSVQTTSLYLPDFMEGGFDE